MPKISDHRCNMLAFHLLWWQLYAIFAPQKMSIDIFSLFLKYGSAFFFAFFDPAGKCTTTKCRLSRRKDERASSDLRLERLMHEVLMKFNFFFHVNKDEGNRDRHKTLGNKDWSEVWRSAVPEAFTHDL